MWEAAELERRLLFIRSRLHPPGDGSGIFGPGMALSSQHSHTSLASLAAAASSPAGALLPVNVGARAAARNRSESVNSSSGYFGPDALEAPLDFLPCDTDMAQLADYRETYRRFRMQEALGAQGEVSQAVGSVMTVFTINNLEVSARACRLPPLPAACLRFG